MTPSNLLPAKTTNRVISNYKGVPIRIYNSIYIRVTVDEYIKFIDASIDFGLSARNAIIKHNLLCETIVTVSAAKPEFIGCVYRGKKIRRYNKIKVNVSIQEYKSFIDAKVDWELSARHAIIKKKLLCACYGLVPIGAN